MIRLTLLITFFALNTIAQRPSDAVDPANINFGLIESLFLKKHNEHRKQLGLQALSSDVALKKAAADHSSFMVKTKNLTHEQPNQSKRDGGARITFYKGDFKAWGENVIYISLKQFDNATKKSYFLSYQETADKLFTNWKNSKQHYKSMINPEYSRQGVAFNLGDNNRLYGTQLFAD